MKLKELRLKNNLSQMEISKKCGISLVAYNKYENGLRYPQFETLIKLADIFDVSLDYLCERQWNNQIGYIPDDKKELIQKILQLKDIKLAKAEAYITALLED